ncbi:hypothetical protein B0H15DRAFT_911170 [Mycena belliarum]|uniref:Proteophosphoglycan ppg4 n=1 Tax=Mycena belliarum TaxID=1033014 RepID=A0AAD6U053_9AGAR|nr:hypothetical protein B0H15DRAFT_911170 [Mycena belliae]
MAAALLPSRIAAGPSTSPAVFHRALLAEHDYADSRYPSPRTTSVPTPEHSRSYPPQHAATAPPDVQSLKSNQSQDPPRSAVSYVLPPGAARRVVERYSLEDTTQRAPSRASEETRPTALESNQDPAKGLQRQSPSQEFPASLLPSAPRHPALPALGVGAGSSRPNTPNYTPPIMPLSASPGYNPPVSPNPRAYAHQPTYITPPPAPRPVALSTPQEEVCVECAMRDQDMIDVDVTTPGVWERESDVMFDDLLRRELEDEATGVVPGDDSSRPRARGGLLTEQNLKAWLSVNPREPAARQQTLNTYIKSQRTLLEAEALARARAMQEAKQLDSRMRDTYSQLRRSAYDTGSSPTPADDTGAIRIKPPRSPASPNHPGRSHSREVTLLENGMIVEHVDVRKEEKEARERRRKEEKRARKSSRSSFIDVNSIISAQSFNPNIDSGVGLKPYSRYSQASSARPTSVLTAPPDRAELPRAYSQASFSDIHSLGSASPRRTRFFGIKNLSGGWRSQDSLAPSGISGSMMDMHVALQNEMHGQRVSSPVDMATARRSQLWPSMDTETRETQIVQDKPKKKRKGLAKIWGIVTGSSKQQNSSSREPSQSYERTEDDGPLAPPPPLSYLVNRGHAGDGGRHASTPSLPSTSSPKLGLSSPGMSSSTAPSSILPSPASSRGPDVDAAEQRKSNGTYEEDQHPSDDTIGKSQPAGTRNVHPVTSEPDMRRASQTPPPISRLPNGAARPRPDSVMSSRDKSLPPLPTEAFVRPPDARPRTIMSFTPPPGSAPAHDFLPPQAPFRTAEARRQSFGGLSSRPTLGLQTVPVTQPVAFDERRPFGPRYDEYGLSRRSLGRLDNVQEHPAARSSPVPMAAKRRSRFGLSSLLGKKSTKGEAAHEGAVAAQQFPSMRRSGSEGAEDYGTGYATSNSRHSAFSTGGPRMSVTSRKALEDLVAQDPDFVAYRYPSNDQHLDILR